MDKKLINRIVIALIWLGVGSYRLAVKDMPIGIFCIAIALVFAVGAFISKKQDR